MTIDATDVTEGPPSWARVEGRQYAVFQDGNDEWDLATIESCNYVTRTSYRWMSRGEELCDVICVITLPISGNDKPEMIEG